MASTPPAPNPARGHRIPAGTGTQYRPAGSTTRKITPRITPPTGPDERHDETADEVAVAEESHGAAEGEAESAPPSRRPRLPHARYGWAKPAAPRWADGAPVFASLAACETAWRFLQAAELLEPDLSWDLYGLVMLYRAAAADAPPPDPAAVAAMEAQRAFISRRIAEIVAAGKLAVLYGPEIMREAQETHPLPPTPQRPVPDDWAALRDSTMPSWVALREALLHWADRWGMVDPERATMWGVGAALWTLAAMAEWSTLPRPEREKRGRVEHRAGMYWLMPGVRIADCLAADERGVGKGTDPEAEALVDHAALMLTLDGSMFDLREGPRATLEQAAIDYATRAIKAHFKRAEDAFGWLGYEPPEERREGKTVDQRPEWFARNVVSRWPVRRIAEHYHVKSRETVKDGLRQMSADLGLPPLWARAGRPSIS